MRKKSKEKRKLISIVRHLKNSHNFLIKAFWYLLGFYYGGALKAKYQEWFAKKIGWEPKNLTIVNIIIFGFGGGIIYFVFKENAMGFVSQYFVSWMAKLFHIAIAQMLGIYTIYNLVQSFFRLVYAEVNGKAIVAFNLFGLAANILHFLVIFLHRDVLKQKHEFHG